jgi:ABC-type microcin C transport system duplicated ATPase subunit YejF
MDRRARRRLGGAIQAVFQDPRGSLNPRLTVGEAIAEPLRVHAPRRSCAERQRTVHARMAAVGLDQALTQRFPTQLSGGQCQRVAIARATVLRPDLLVCDEAVSALDVSVQAQVLHLIDGLRREDGMAVIFISHDIAVVAALADHIVVMQAGRIVDQGDRAWLLRGGRAAYTRHLLSSMVQL